MAVRPIAHMSTEELAAYTPEQMVEMILDDNFDRAALSRGLALNLSRDILDCLRAYGAACAAQERERAVKAIQVLIDRDRALGNITATIHHTEARNILAAIAPPHAGAEEG